MMTPKAAKHQKLIFRISLAMAILLSIAFIQGLGVIGGLWNPITENQGELLVTDFVWKLVKVFLADAVAIFFAYNFRPGAQIKQDNQ